MAGKGGARPGAGRKPKSEEQKTAELAKAAILKKYGSVEKAFEHLLSCGVHQLEMFAWQHAFGKPQDKVEHTGEMTIQTVTGMKIV